MPRKKKQKTQLFKKILIANRGEIACRIIRTCHALGIQTVAVYSDADVNSLHVRDADEAVRIGPPPAAESYLNIQAVMDAAKQTNSEAIHPGYGFLSESSDFVAACHSANITFIGPSNELMEMMKDKAEARRLAGEAGLPLLPGTEGDVDDKEALSRALEIGFPVMVKASQGGGGIGIRMVSTPDEMPAALSRARSLGKSAFGSSDIYIEKFLEGPSHVEVQVIADHYGNSVHLYERDCSIQRRNQKVIEETPTSKIGRRRRNRMYDAALTLVKHIGYTNAGTVEFLVDNEENFYFLEMNTRLQVEHPVTEMITGLDMVELQIRIAAGESLPFSQKDVERQGHAIEARIYPEDPYTLMPMSGRIESLQLPKDKHIRVDSALFPGYEISPYYDPLMAKVAAWGKSRKRAIDGLRRGLRHLSIEGISHNIPLIQWVLEDEDFRKGIYSTSSLPGIIQKRQNPTSELSEQEQVAAVATALGTLFGATPATQRPSSPWKGYGRMSQMGFRSRGGQW